MLAPGSRIGILGGGQLGRMLAMAGARLGFDIAIYSHEAGSPAGRVAAREHVGAYDDFIALKAFAEGLDAVTFEFENVPAAAIEFLSALGMRVAPGGQALAAAQDRVTEKDFFRACGVATVAYAAVDDAASLEAALATVGAPAILKTRRLGYDGKGQARVRDAEEAEAAYASVGGGACVWEAWTRFNKEVSVVAARGEDGAFVPFDLCENTHEGGILRRTRAPAKVSKRAAQRALAATRRIAERLNYVGVLCVEYFLMRGDVLLANEMAPRVHNSGHWTEAACVVSQFEQHMRAVAGWPLAPPERWSEAEMENLIGAEAERWRELAADPAVMVHLYGKGEARPGRKMGHATRLLARRGGLLK